MPGQPSQLRPGLLFADKSLQKQVKKSLLVRFQADLRVGLSLARLGQAFVIHIDMHVATPSTPLPVGNDRISRRNTIAASLRNGSESIIPVVPCVLPSHGSVHAPAKGTA